MRLPIPVSELLSLITNNKVLMKYFSYKLLVGLSYFCSIWRLRERGRDLVFTFIYFGLGLGLQIIGMIGASGSCNHVL